MTAAGKGPRDPGVPGDDGTKTQSDATCVARAASEK